MFADLVDEVGDFDFSEFLVDQFDYERCQPAVDSWQNLVRLSAIQSWRE